MAKSIGFIGGTGPEGKGLAARFAYAGFEVVIGSRSAERGAEAAKEITEATDGGKARGGTNDEAASADLVIVTIPYAGQQDTLVPLAKSLAGKIVISAVVPMTFEGGRPRMHPVDAGSAAQEIQLLLPDSMVVGGFQNLAAHKLMDLTQTLEGDVLVCSDHPSATREVMELAGELEGIRGVNAGPLSSSVYIEAITALLVNINRIHKKETHIQIVGI